MTFLVILMQIILNGLYPNNVLVENADHNEGNIIVKVENISQIKGEILVGIYANRRTFRKIKKVYKYVVKEVQSDDEEFLLEGVPYGTYAIAIFQDFNGNRKFDTNFMGIPKEPFGFSTNFIVKRRAPKFKDVTFDHSEESTTMNVKLQEF